MNINENSRMILKIEKLSQGGDGIARIPAVGTEGRDYVVFVPYSAPGDEVEVQILEKKNSYARAKIIRVVQPSSQRVTPQCSHFFVPNQSISCGGCDFQHLNYADQTHEKENNVRETLQKIGGFSQPNVLPIIGIAENAWHYRNKVQVPFSKNKKNEIVAGFYAPQSHEIVPMKDCWIQSQPMTELVHFVRQKMQNLRLDPYSEKTHRGWLRHLLVRESFSDKKIHLVFVTAKDFFPKFRDWIEPLRARFPQLAGVSQNINMQHTNVILGRKWKLLWGKDYLVESLNQLGKQKMNLKLKISTGSFFQVNTPMAEKLYSTVQQFALESKERDLFMDLYCGVGAIALSCASYFNRVIGVEEAVSSIHDAQENARNNGFINCEFICKQVHSFLPFFQSKMSSSKITMVVDPPRSGCEPYVVKEILRIQPHRVIYVSCDPSTLARDLKILCGQGGYQLKKVQPFDLFPQTAHVESVAVLEK